MNNPERSKTYVVAGQIILLLLSTKVYIKFVITIGQGHNSLSRLRLEAKERNEAEEKKKRNNVAG